MHKDKYSHGKHTNDLNEEKAKTHAYGIAGLRQSNMDQGLADPRC